MSTEEHLNKGFQCHENGSVKESTYHFRLAAMGGSPTGMLFYALACRHGWGMRPQQKEGVEWLRKAVECASLEIAEDEDHAKEGKTVDPNERKTHKARFALSIYELGVSHMNGWGIEQDKALALRCFEIAGSECPRRDFWLRVRLTDLTCCRLGRRGRFNRSWFLLCSGRWLQEGSEEERQVLQVGRGQRDGYAR